MENLPISRLIDVQVNLSPLAAQAQNLSTLLIVGSSGVIDSKERIRSYDSIDAVATDFGTDAPEYLAAALYFEQTPQPSQLMIGAWAKSALPAKLVGGPVSAANQSMAVWNALTSGSFVITTNGGAQQTVTGLNFTGQTNLNGVASVISAALTGATCVWNAAYSRFEITSTINGAGSSVSFMGTGPSSDISGLMAMRSDSSGAYVASGIGAETAVAAASLLDSQFGQQWYAMTFLGAADSDHLSIAQYIEAANNKHLYGVSTQEGGVLSANDTSDIAYQLKALNYKRSVVQYSSQSAYAVCSLLGRAITVDYNGNATVITLMYKQEPGIVAESLTETQIEALEAKNCNVFVAYNNNTAIVEPGKVASGDFIDEITGTDWLAVTLMTAVYNLLYTTPTKIPQTDAGVHLIVVTCESVCSQGVANGLLAAGVWNSAGFGSLNQGDFLPKGYYIYAQPVADQLQADREARKSPPIQIAAKLAGAVHTVDVIISVNR